MRVKARTQTQILAGSTLEFALELTDSSPESADSCTDFMIVSQQPILLNMFDICMPIQLAGRKWLTIAVNQHRPGSVSMGL